MDRILVLVSLMSACATTTTTPIPPGTLCQVDTGTTYAADEATPSGVTAGELSDTWSSVDLAVTWGAPAIPMEPALADGTYAIATDFTEIHAATGPLCPDGVWLQGVPTTTSDDRLNATAGVMLVISPTTTSFVQLSLSLDVPLTVTEKAAIQTAIEAAGETSVVVEDTATFVLVSPDNQSEALLRVAYTSDLGANIFALQTGTYTLTQ